MENELMIKADKKEVRITSVELVDIINELRTKEFELGLNGKGQKPLQHKNFMAKIRNEVEVLKSLGLDGQLNFKPSSYVNSQNKEQPCYSLNRDGMLQMLNSESVYVRAKTIEKINELENKIIQLQKQETQLANLLVAIYNGGQEGVVASKQLAEIEVKKATAPLLETIETNKPKVEYHDSVLNSKRLVTVREIAVDLGTSAIKLNKFLNENGIQYKDKVNNTWLLYAKHSNFINDGLCDYKITDYGQQLKWTELGRKYIIDLWNSKQN